VSYSVKKQPGASTGDTEVVGLFPSKQNDGTRLKPVGLEFTFTDDQIAVRSVNLAAVDGLADRLPVATRIIHALEQRGGQPMTYAELSTALDVKVNSVIQTVTRGKAFVKVTSTDGIQRIALKERHLRVV
jgi:hypothetical protein